MKKLAYDYCHAAPVLEWMSQKWALVAMMRIKEACRDKTDRGIRFSDLFRTIPHISEKVLASTLNYLEGEGLVERTSYESMPPCVEYSLTPLAQNFLREIRTMLMIGNIRECHLISLTCTGNKKPPHFEYLPYIPFIIPFDSLVILTTIHYLYLYDHYASNN